VQNPRASGPLAASSLVGLLPGEKRAAKAASLSVIDCHDTSDKDAAYWKHPGR